MWFYLSLLALLMLVTRRSTEKRAVGKFDGLAMTWLQQAFALPFIGLSLFFAPFLWPGDLSVHFWIMTLVYVLFSCVDIYLYFRALGMADISHVAPLMSLVSVGNIAGAYLVLGQKPSVMGIGGALLIVSGATVIHRSKQKHNVGPSAMRQVLWLILTIVVIRSYYSNIEVNLLRESNPIVFNFYTSVIFIPIILLVTLLIRRRYPVKNYWKSIGQKSRTHILPMVIIGLTYTINLIATFNAKLISPNAGYITAVKSAQILPIVLIGVFFFKEKVVGWQWVGLILITFGLTALAFS